MATEKVFANRAQLIDKLLGARTRAVENPEAATSIGTTETLLMRQNPQRVAAIFVNLSANTIYVWKDPQVGSTRGFRLAPNGGSLSLVYLEDFDLLGYDWWAEAAAAASTLFSMEIVLD